MFAQGDYGLRPAVDFPQLTRTAATGIRNVLTRRRIRGRVTRELNGYTDRELSDIGLSRLDIPDVAAGRYKR